MNRRELLRILGGALAIPVLSGWPAERLDAVGRAAHRRVRDGDHALRVLDPHQRDAVAAIAEMIIPETDTQGASAARVPEFVDLLPAEGFPADDRARFLPGLADVDARSPDLFGADFVPAREAQRTATLSGPAPEAP